MEECWSSRRRRMRFQIVLITIFSLIGLVRSTCHPQSNTFLHSLRLQCPFSISSSHPIQVNGESFERLMISKPKNAYTAVLFYGSWCPFSSSFQPKFEALSSMFPQIKHIQLEQSSVMPSVFSKYGVHSLPALLIINQTSKVRYFGPKDIYSLKNFYKRTTGFEPVKHLAHDNSAIVALRDFQRWYDASSWTEILKEEPYLIFAVMFLMLRTFFDFCPELWSRSRVLWVKLKHCLNLGVFGESRQLVGHAVHLIDVKRVWGKLKLCKTRGFHKGATRSARVWASSLTSVSLGETSSSSARPMSSMVES